MFEFKIAELKVNDEFTINDGETWNRVTSVGQVDHRSKKKVKAKIVNPPSGYEDVEYTLERHVRETVIVR